jgi:hypothetical protein
VGEAFRLTNSRADLFISAAESPLAFFAWPGGIRTKSAVPVAALTFTLAPGAEFLSFSIALSFFAACAVMLSDTSRTQPANSFAILRIIVISPEVF